MRKRTALFAVLAVMAATMAAGGPATAQVDPSDRATGDLASDFTPRSPDELVHVFIQLDEPSVAEVAASRTNVSAAQQRAQGSDVKAQQDAVSSALGDLIVEERSRMVVGANGIRAIVRAGDMLAIRSTDGVESVGQVTKFYPSNETSVPWIGAAPGDLPGLTGDGVTIAVIDTGIDYTHGSLGGSGDPDDFLANDPGFIEAGTFPTAKVVGGFDFAGPNYDASSPDPTVNTPSPDADPLDGDGHGTHVSGSAAGQGTAEVGAGVAPGASLLALKVFGDVAGSSDVVSDAIEFALDPNNDMSVDDAVDVINMSLGSDFGHPDDPSAIASQNAVDLGVSVVVASGNAGPVPYVNGSPSLAPGAIAVAASIDGGVTALALQITDPADIPDMEMQPGDFGPLDPTVDGDLVVAEPYEACEPLTNSAAIDGNIALISRGTCEFGVKVANAQDAGAIAAVVVNNVPGDPIVMGAGAHTPVATIPGVMISQADGQTLLDVLDTPATVTVSINDDTVIAKPGLADTMASFTSRGPGFNSTFKPEISAPGFSIESAAVGGGNAGALNSGTSMATPHVAGVAALLLDQDGTRTPAQVKSLIMNSARPALTDPAGGTVDLAIQGNGVVQADVAAIAESYTTPAAVSFGRINPTAAYTDTETIDLTFTGSGDATYDLELEGNQVEPGVTWSLSDTSVTTSSGTASFDVTIDVDPTAMSADPGVYSQRESDGWIRVTDTDSGAEMVVGLMAVVDPAADISATGGEGMVSLTNAGPSDGPAEGFTLVADGASVMGSLAATGYRTTATPDYDVIEFGVALNNPWASASALEFDILIDADQDGVDDYAVVAADFGFLTGSADPTGDLASALFDLNAGGALLLYLVDTDNNDGVISIPADVNGDFGFLADGDTTFDMSVAVFDQLGLAGVSDAITVDLGAEIGSPGGLSVPLTAAASADVEVEGEGDLLWLFANNAVPDQHEVVAVTTADTGEPEPPVEPPEGEVPSFDDVPDDHLFNTEITWLAEQGITRGCNPPANTLFCPDDNVTRGQMAAFLNRALDLGLTTEDFFVDDNGSVFEGDINELAAADITKGCNPPTNDEFCPDRELSRAEMATFMMRGYGFTDGAGDDLFIDDDSNIHEGAIDVIGTAGVTRGCNPPTNSQYCPDRLITRGEMAAFIYRAHQAAGLGD